MKPIDKLAHKYALNINQIRGPTSSKKLDFKNLNIGFYDSIAKNDISIKKNQTILKRVKDSSMKEFIYSNREIPMNWKHKQDYRDNLLSFRRILVNKQTCGSTEVSLPNSRFTIKLQ